jgi:hypothetical protein
MLFAMWSALPSFPSPVKNAWSVVFLALAWMTYKVTQLVNRVINSAHKAVAQTDEFISATAGEALSAVGDTSRWTFKRLRSVARNQLNAVSSSFGVQYIRNLLHDPEPVCVPTQAPPSWMSNMTFGIWKDPAPVCRAPVPPPSWTDRLVTAVQELPFDTVDYVIAALFVALIIYNVVHLFQQRYIHGAPVVPSSAATPDTANIVNCKCKPGTCFDCKCKKNNHPCGSHPRYKCNCGADCNNAKTSSLPLKNVAEFSWDEATNTTTQPPGGVVEQGLVPTLTDRARTLHGIPFGTLDDVTPLFPRVFAFIGGQDSGKSFAITSLLHHYNVNKNNYFKFGVIITGQRASCGFDKHISSRIICCAKEQQDKFWSHIEALQQLRAKGALAPNFIVLDDIVGLVDLLKMSEFLSKHKHHNTTVIVAIQRTKSGLVPIWRELTQTAFMFHTTNKSEMKDFNTCWGIEPIDSNANFSRLFPKLTPLFHALVFVKASVRDESKPESFYRVIKCPAVPEDWTMQLNFP